MPTPADRFVEAHPRAGRAWYLVLARVLGPALTLPGLQRLRPLSRRLKAVAQPTERVAVMPEPRHLPGERRSGLTVISANLWHDWPRHTRLRERLESFARLVEDQDTDIVLLQEVIRTPSFRADAWLAERLGLAMAYARANGDSDMIGFEEGPAILSRFPLGDVHLRQLSHGRNPLARRMALAAQVQSPYGPLLVVSVHLGLLPGHNAGQIRRLRAWVSGLSGGEVAVVGGDFNAPEHRPEIAQTQATWTDSFRRANPQGVAVTHARRRALGGLLRRRLDYIFVKQPGMAHWLVTESGHLETPVEPHSDHWAVLARLLPPSTSR